MICPVCRTRMHGNICENCGYSIKKEKCEIANDEIDEYEENGDKDVTLQKYLKVHLILVLILASIGLIYYFTFYNVKRNEVKNKEEVIEKIPNTEGEVFQENLSPYGYSTEENDEKLNGEVKVKKIDPKADKEIKEGVTYDFYYID